MSQTQSSRSQPRTSIPLSGVSRPAWRVTRQDIISLRDGSASMEGRKAVAAAAANEDLIAVLAEPENQDAFVVGIVDFAERSRIVQPLMAATVLKGNVPPLDFVHGLGVCTNITAALQDGERMLLDAARAREGGASRARSVLVLYSDGCHNEGP